MKQALQHFRGIIVAVIIKHIKVDLMPFNTMLSVVVCALMALRNTNKQTRNAGNSNLG